MNALSEAAKVTRVSNAVAAGQTTINSASIDTNGYDGALFILGMGAITSGAVTSLKLQGSHDDSVWADLAGTGQAIADDDDNQVFATDVVLPTYRYLRAVVSRATQDSAVDGIVALQYRAEQEPVTHDASTVGGVQLHAAPISGTA